MTVPKAIEEKDVEEHGFSVLLCISSSQQQVFNILYLTYILHIIQAQILPLSPK